jgi:dihydroxyacetone kinase-like protein
MNSAKLIEILDKIGDKIIEQKDYLTELDRPIGDNDHGINMAKGFGDVKEKLPGLADKDIGTILKTTGMALVNKVGGSSGPLYGTFYMKMGMALNGKTELTFDDFLAAFQMGVEGVGMRGKSTVEEATMLDAMVPALNAMRAAWEQNQDVKAAVEAGVEAAVAGAEHTKDLVATKGRASYVGERGIGHQDPGATSFVFMIQTAAENL